MILALELLVGDMDNIFCYCRPICNFILYYLYTVYTNANPIIKQLSCLSETSSALVQYDQGHTAEELVLSSSTCVCVCLLTIAIRAAETYMLPRWDLVVVSANKTLSLPCNSLWSRVAVLAVASKTLSKQSSSVSSSWSFLLEAVHEHAGQWLLL